MKKRVTLIMLLVSMLLVLASCGKATTKNDVSNKASSETESVKETPKDPSLASFDVSMINLNELEEKYVNTHTTIGGYSDVRNAIIYKQWDDYDESKYICVHYPGFSYAHLDDKERVTAECNGIYYVVSTDKDGIVRVLKNTKDEDLELGNDDKNWDYITSQLDRTGMASNSIISEDYETEGVVKNVVVTDVSHRVSDICIAVAAFEDEAYINQIDAKLRDYSDTFNVSLYTKDLFIKSNDERKPYVDKVAAKNLEQLYVHTLGGQDEFVINNIVYVGSLSNGVDVYGYDSNVDMVANGAYARKTVADFEAAGFEKYQGENLLDGYTLMRDKKDEVSSLCFINCADEKVYELTIYSFDIEERDGREYVYYSFMLADGQCMEGYVGLDKKTGTALAVSYDKYISGEPLEGEAKTEENTNSQEALIPEGDFYRYLVVYEGTELSKVDAISTIREATGYELAEAKAIVEQPKAVLSIFGAKEEAALAVNFLSENFINVKCYGLDSEIYLGNTFRIDNVFNLSGRGPVATGISYDGSFYNGENVYIVKQDGTAILTEIVEIEVFRNKLTEVEAGTNAGIELKDVLYTDITKGDVLVPLEQ